MLIPRSLESHWANRACFMALALAAHSNSPQSAYGHGLKYHHVRVKFHWQKSSEDLDLDDVQNFRTWPDKTNNVSKEITRQPYFDGLYQGFMQFMPCMGDGRSYCCTNIRDSYEDYMGHPGPVQNPSIARILIQYPSFCVADYWFVSFLQLLMLATHPPLVVEIVQGPNCS